MKTKGKLFWVLLSLLLLCKLEAHSQSYSDTTLNYYTITNYFDNYYDSIEQLYGIDSLKSFGYKKYIRWKNFMDSRHGEEGNLGSIWDITNNYYDNDAGYRSDDYQASWSFVGPNGLPPNPGNGSEGGNGEGMVTTIWVDTSNFNMVFAGTHNGGLWKTTDGGDSWINLTDSDCRVSKRKTFWYR
jgi:hypothetical protein